MLLLFLSVLWISKYIRQSSDSTMKSKKIVTKMKYFLALL